MSAQKYEDYKSKYFAIYESVKKDGKTSVLVYRLLHRAYANR
ncbi:hypothetical protein [Clostridium perfringens]